MAGRVVHETPFAAAEPACRARERARRRRKKGESDEETTTRRLGGRRRIGRCDARGRLRACGGADARR